MTFRNVLDEWDAEDRALKEQRKARLLALLKGNAVTRDDFFPIYWMAMTCGIELWQVSGLPYDDVKDWVEARDRPSGDEMRQIADRLAEALQGEQTT